VAASNVEIWNRALTALGNRASIASEDEASAEARALATVYWSSVDELLEGTDWRFAQRFVGPIYPISGDPPHPAWSYWHAVPANVVRLRELLGTIVRPNDPEPWERFNDVVHGPVVMSCHEQPTFRYTWQVRDPALFTAGFTATLEYYLASKVALQLTSSPAVQQAMASSYIRALSIARTNMEGIPPLEEKSSYIKARV
jgi:hypothetical protein